MIIYPEHVQDVLNELRNKGFAVVIFTPAELQGVAPDVVEEDMVIKGWDCINECKDPLSPDYNWEDEIEVYPTGELA